MAYAFEQGPIRPPSEARSLLIRVTRNCPWNKCEFCNIYKGKTFSKRSVQEVKADIEAARALYDEIQALSWRMGLAGRVDDQLVQLLWSDPRRYGDSHRSMAAWMYFGARNVFLQDANSLILETEDLVEILKFLKSTFPSIDRITSYARSSTLRRKSLEELKALKEAGLSRIHVGMESGYDPLLKFMQKGVTAQGHMEAGKKVVEAGISLSEYMLLGLGGRRWWKEHAIESARVINQINPHFIRIRTLTVRPGMPLHQKILSGDFQLQSEEEIVREERLFIETLEGITSQVASDHILNLLEEVEGKLPQDKDRMLEVIDEYLNLSERDKLVYNLGRRGHAYRSVKDLSDLGLKRRVEAALDRFIEEHSQDLDSAFNQLRNDFI
ncbi:MAG: radical SAM protein [bacterium]